MKSKIGWTMLNLGAIALVVLGVIGTKSAIEYITHTTAEDPVSNMRTITIEDVFRFEEQYPVSIVVNPQQNFVGLYVDFDSVSSYITAQPELPVFLEEKANEISDKAYRFNRGYPVTQGKITYFFTMEMGGEPFRRFTQTWDTNGSGAMMMEFAQVVGIRHYPYQEAVGEEMVITIKCR